MWWTSKGLSALQVAALKRINAGEVTHDFASNTYQGASKLTIKPLIRRGLVKQPTGMFGCFTPVSLSDKGRALIKAL